MDVGPVGYSEQISEKTRQYHARSEVISDVEPFCQRPPSKVQQSLFLHTSAKQSIARMTCVT